MSYAFGCVFSLLFLLGGLGMAFCSRVVEGGAHSSSSSHHHRPLAVFHTEHFHAAPRSMQWTGGGGHLYSGVSNITHAPHNIIIALEVFLVSQHSRRRDHAPSYCCCCCSSSSFWLAPVTISRSLIRFQNQFCKFSLPTFRLNFNHETKVSKLK